MNDLNFLSQIRIIAVVGLSDKPERASYQVAEFLISKGYTIIPVNPMIESVLGLKSYPSLADIPQEIQVELVDIFRKSEEVMPIVEAAIARKVPHIWLQEGVKNEEAIKYAEDHGATVAADVCLMKTMQARG